VQLGVARHFRIAVARQVDQQRLDLLDDGRVLAVLATCAPPIEKKLMCWVRPGVLDAKARPFWLVRILIAVDLPALERPAKAISGTWCAAGRAVG
jgi:hypothetical protein